MIRFFVALLLALPLFVSAQTPESDARSKIQVMRGVPVTKFPNYSISDAFKAVTDLSVKRTPYLTISELRAGKADTARAVNIVQGDVSGEFVYDPTDTSTPDDSVITIVYGSRRYKRQYNYVEAKWFSLVPGGIVDNLSQLTKLFSKAGGKPIVFPLRQIYYVSDNIHINTTLNVDFNGCKILAPNGIIDRKATDLSFSAGNYLTTTKNQMTFPSIPGITNTVGVGSIILIRANTPYNPVGDYYDGQVLKVVKVNPDGSFLIDKPIYKSFQVDIIEIYAGSDLVIKNLDLDMTTGSQAQKGFNTFCYKNVILENIIAYGANESACAFEVVADNIKVSNCEAHGFLNTVGIGGSSRMGYGFALNGNYVYAQSVRGSRCKHVITNNQRNIMTLDFHVEGFKGSNPATEFDLASGLSGGGPMYQAAIDFHGNCINAFITNSEYDGCNGAIAIRNGNAIISNMKIRSRSVSSSFSNYYLINIYENPIENVIVNDAEVYVDPPLSGQTDLASLIGVQSTITTGSNKNIIVNNLIMNGGKLFNMLVSNTSGASCNIDKIVFKNVNASLDAGINIAGTSSFLTGTIGRIEIQGNISIKSNADKTLKLLNTEFVGVLGEVIMKNSYFDCTNITETVAIRVNCSGNTTPPYYMDFSNSHIIAGASGLNFANSTYRPWGRAIFDGMKLDYNKGALSSLTFIPGVYGSLQNAVNDEWTFKGARIRNLGSVALGSNFECLLFPQLSKLNIDGIDINTNINISNTSYFSTLAAARQIPFTARNTTGYITFLNYRIKDGKMFLPSANVTNPTLATATPNSITPLFDSQVIYHEGYNGVAPYGWISYNNAWRKLNAVD